MTASLSSESYPSFDGWEERAGDPGTTLPSPQPPLVKGCPVAVAMVCLIAVIALCTLVGWLIVVEPNP